MIAVLDGGRSCDLVVCISGVLFLTGARTNPVATLKALSKQEELAATRLKVETEAGAASRTHAEAIAELESERDALEESNTNTSTSLTEAITAIEQECKEKDEAVAIVDVLKATQLAAEEKLNTEIASLKEFLAAAAKARDEARDDYKREQSLLEDAKGQIAQGEADVQFAAAYKDKWEAKENELVQIEGELKGTQVQLDDTRTLLGNTQTHTLDLQKKLSHAMTELDRLKQQSASVDQLKSNLAMAYADMESCREKFTGALSTFNTATAASGSLHMFDF
jgi:DNA repair exonuclease SbcCD ATPase subunit